MNILKFLAVAVGLGAIAYLIQSRRTKPTKPTLPTLPTKPTLPTIDPINLTDGTAPSNGTTTPA